MIHDSFTPKAVFMDDTCLKPEKILACIEYRNFNNNLESPYISECYDPNRNNY
jgi:hypothetical protein